MDEPRSLFTHELGNGRLFVASDVLEPELPPYAGWEDDQVRRFIREMWAKDFRAKQPYFEEMATDERYYSGHHYLDAQQNRQNEITNLSFSLVEGVHGATTEVRPRPEIIPLSAAADHFADDLQEFATWMMNATQFDSAVRICQRPRLKYGTCVYLVVIDPFTGIAWPRHQSVWDYYPDLTARNESELERFSIAQPVPVRRLRAMFPEHAHLITPDNYASPSYEVMQRPYLESANISGFYPSASTLASTIYNEGEPTPSTTATLVPAPGQQLHDADTAFLIQMIVRDYTAVDVAYQGIIAEPDPMNPGRFTHVPGIPATRREPACVSGWRVLNMLASGLLLPSWPLDPCFLGLPIVVGRDHQHEDRYWGVGELRNVIPINRGINRRTNLLNRAGEFEALPLLVADRNTGIDLDLRGVEPGEVLKKLQGSQIEWLQPKGVSSQQQALLQLEYINFDRVSGYNDAQEGMKPPGADSGVAIRELQQAGGTRVRSKQNPLYDELAMLLRKCMYATGKKAKNPILFRGSNGKLRSVDGQTLMQMFDIRFVQGSGQKQTRQENEDRTVALAGAGLIDQQAALKDLDYPGRDEVVARMSAQRMMEAQAAAQAQANAGEQPAQ